MFLFFLKIGVNILKNSIKPNYGLLLLVMFSYMTPYSYGMDGHDIPDKLIEFVAYSGIVPFNHFENSCSEQTLSDGELNLNKNLNQIKKDEENQDSQPEGVDQTKMIKMLFHGGISLLVLIISTFIILLFRIKQKEVQEKKHSLQQKKYFDTALEEQEKDRKRIASKLHDSVGQMLSLIKLNISELNDSACGKTGEYKEVLERSLKIIDDACTEVRSISHNLMPGSLISLGLIPASRDLIRTINETSNIKVTLNTVLNGERFDEKFEVAFFRILQELISNAIKHSQASNINVDFSSEGNSLKLTIKDNGIGFNSEMVEESSGLGWKNISSRLSLINGEMNVQTENGWGSIVTVSAQAN